MFSRDALLNSNPELWEKVFTGVPEGWDQVYGDSDGDGESIVLVRASKPGLWATINTNADGTEMLKTAEDPELLVEELPCNARESICDRTLKCGACNRFVCNCAWGDLNTDPASGSSDIT